MNDLAVEIFKAKQEAETRVLGLMLWCPTKTRRIAWAHGVTVEQFDSFDMRLIFVAIDHAGKTPAPWIKLALDLLKFSKQNQWDAPRLAHLVASECYWPAASTVVPDLLARWCDRLSDLTKRTDFARECLRRARMVLRDGLTHRVSLPTGIPQKPEVKSTRDKRTFARQWPASKARQSHRYPLGESRP